MKMRIAVDFNTMMIDPDERVSINTEFAPELAALLRAGQVIILYDETLEVEATAEYDKTSRRWLARPHWATSRDLAPVAAMNPAVHRAD